MLYVIIYELSLAKRRQSILSIHFVISDKNSIILENTVYRRRVLKYCKAENFRLKYCLQREHEQPRQLKLKEKSFNFQLLVKFSLLN